MNQRALVMAGPLERITGVRLSLPATRTGLFVASALTLSAQLQFVPDQQCHAVFAGPNRMVPSAWSNPGTNPASAEINLRVQQASSSTAAPWQQLPWKRLQLGPGQTLTDSAAIDFPEVRAPTRFVIQWYQDTNRVLGLSQIEVYPRDLLQELRALSGGQPLAVLDPANELKPLLSNLEIEFQDIETTGPERCYTRLAIVFSPAQLGTAEFVRHSILTLVQNGAAVVLIEPPGREPERKRVHHLLTGNSWDAIPSRRHSWDGVPVVAAQRELTADLAAKPQSQLNLLALAREAVGSGCGHLDMNSITVCNAPKE